jgi:hypothetical protein
MDADIVNRVCISRRRYLGNHGVLIISPCVRLIYRVFEGPQLEVIEKNEFSPWKRQRTAFLYHCLVLEDERIRPKRYYQVQLSSSRPGALYSPSWPCQGREGLLRAQGVEALHLSACFLAIYRMRLPDYHLLYEHLRHAID